MDAKEVDKKDVSKAEDMPEQNAPEANAGEGMSVEERLTKLESMVQQLMDAMSSTKGDVEKENVQLPKAEAEKVQDADNKKPAGDEEKDKVNMVKKIKEELTSEVKKEVLEDVKKMFAVNGTTETPRAGQDGFINKSKPNEIAEPKSFKEANAIIKQMKKDKRI